MYDAKLTLFTAQTVTTAAVNGTGLNLLTCTPRRGMKVRCLTTAYSAAVTGINICTPKVQMSTDNTAWYDCGDGYPLTASTATLTDLQYIPVTTFRPFQYIRFVGTPSPTTGSPVWIVQADLGISAP